MTAEEQTTSKPNEELAFSRMREEIEAVAKRKAEDKIKEAKEKGKEILEKSKKEAQEIRNKIISEATSEAEKSMVREVSRKKLIIKMDYLETRESVLEEIFVEAHSELQKFTKSKEYPDFLSNLVKSTGLSIGGGDLYLHLRTEDKGHFSLESLDSLAKEIEEGTGSKTTISVADANLQALGGIKIIRGDDRLFVDNTFESRLERFNEDTRVALLEILG